MLHYFKSHEHESDISFTASTNSFYYFPFLQSTGDTLVLVIEQNHIYNVFAPRARHLNTTGLKFIS